MKMSPLKSDPYQKLATKLHRKTKDGSLPQKDPIFETIGMGYPGLQKLTEPKAFFETAKDREVRGEHGTPTRKFMTGRFESLPNEVMKTSEFTRPDDKNAFDPLVATRSKVFKAPNMGSLEPLLPYKKYNKLKIERKNYFTVPMEPQKKPTYIKLPDLRNAVETSQRSFGLLVGGKTMSSNKIMRKIDLTSSRKLGGITED